MIWIFTPGTIWTDDEVRSGTSQSYRGNAISCLAGEVKSYRIAQTLRQWIEGIRMKVRGWPKYVIIFGLYRMVIPSCFSDNQERCGKASRHDVEQHPNYTKLLRTMAAMQKLTAERHVDVTGLILPTKGEVYRWLLAPRDSQPEDERASGFAEAVLEACRTTGIVCHDTKPYLISEASDSTNKKASSCGGETIRILGNMVMQPSRPLLLAAC